MKIKLKEQFNNIWKVKHLDENRNDWSDKKKEAYQYFLDGYGCAVLNAKEKLKGGKVFKL